MPVEKSKHISFSEVNDEEMDIESCLLLNLLMDLAQS
jgi:hypothetical protein